MAILKSFFNRGKESFLACIAATDNKEKDDKIRLICKIPYIGNCSRDFAKKLSKIIKEHYDCDIICVFTYFKITNYFSLKCATPSLLVPNTVYKFTCLRDADVTYIGKSKRHFVTRRDEHFNFKGKNLTPVALHVRDCETCRQGDYLKKSMQIVQKCSNNFDCEIHEALMIQSQKPSINTQLFESGASFELMVFS